MVFGEKSLKEAVRKREILTGNAVIERVESSSIDLTIEALFFPKKEETIKRKEQLNSARHDRLKLKPGETVIIEIHETFNMPKNFAGIVFPCNRLSKHGLLMTNPGHIDPGFKGKITVCLINMGSEDKILEKGNRIISLLLFEVDSNTEGLCNNPSLTGAQLEQISNTSSDFANISGRTKKMVERAVRKQLYWAISSFAVIITVILILVPLLYSLFDLPQTNAKKLWASMHKEYIKPLEKVIEETNNDLNNHKNLYENQRVDLIQRIKKLESDNKKLEKIVKSKEKS